MNPFGDNKKLPKAWLTQGKNEFYYRKAKEETFRSRAAYKLLQVVKKYNFIKLDNIIVDLGAAPGSWLQIARKLVRDKGFILGVDLKPIDSFSFSNVFTIIGDIYDPEIITKIKTILPRQPDVVLSDVSPNISGIWELDHARQIGLARRSLKIANSILKQNGNFFTKVFQGAMLKEFITDVKKHFIFVKLIKPRASRTKSSELFVLALDFVKP